VSSNNSLCGAFNSQVNKLLEKTVEEYAYLGKENILVIPVGKKVSEFAKRFPNVYDKSLDDFVAKPKYAAAADFAVYLSKLFLDGETDKVEFIYQHFKSAATHVVTRETFLPFHIEREARLLNKSSDQEPDDKSYEVNYIIEPNCQELMDELIPKFIRLKLYAVLLDSLAAEHASRTIAMQIATENADILLQSLKVEYNKSRQQVITNELLDIIGGAVQ
jgi:F-type H+-transporting ATPase subunit gamma